jgi:hypothetical protein
MVISYSDIINRSMQIRSRLPFPYVQGRSWEILRERRVISVGCGSVESEQFLEISQVAAGVVGVDTDPRSGAHFTSLSEIPAGEFNAAVAEHVLEHLTHEQVLDTFRELARILPKDSPVIITLPNIMNFGGWFNNFDHKNFSPPTDTAAMLELHGFHVIDLFGWSKPDRFRRHQEMDDGERRLCAIIEQNWGLTLPQYVTIGAVRV